MSFHEKVRAFMSPTNENDENSQNSLATTDKEKTWKKIITAMPISQAKQAKVIEVTNKVLNTYEMANEILQKLEPDKAVTGLGILDSISPVLHMMKHTEDLFLNHPEILDKIIEDEDVVEIESPELLEDLLFYVEFSEMAYDGDRDISLSEFLELADYTEVFHQSYVDVEQPSFFMAFDSVEKNVIIGIKGTSSASDCLTDVLCRTEPFLEDSYTHEGMKNAAYCVVKKCRKFIEELFVPLGYNFILVGHSLGAGSAALASVIIKEELKVPTKVTCYAIGCPPVLDKKKALEVDYIFSLVNCRDIIPRTSLSNMRIARKYIAAAKFNLKEKKIQSTSEFAFDMLAIAKENRLPYENDLYVPGRVIYLYEGIGKDGYRVMKCIEKTGVLNTICQPIFSTEALYDHMVYKYSDSLKSCVRSKFGKQATNHVDVNNVTYIQSNVNDYNKFNAVKKKNKENKENPILDSIMFYQIQSMCMLAEPMDLNDNGHKQKIANYSVWKRNSDFVMLLKELSDIDVGELPPLPSKTINTGPEKRSLLYDAFLNSLISKSRKYPNSIVKQVLLDFLGAGRGAKYDLDLNEQVDQMKLRKQGTKVELTIDIDEDDYVIFSELEKPEKETNNKTI